MRLSDHVPKQDISVAQKKLESLRLGEMAVPVSPCQSAQVDRKTNNALVQKQRLDKNHEATTVDTASTVERLQKNVLALPKGGSPKIGQKRSIAQVNGTEESTQSLVTQAEPLAPTLPEDEIERVPQKEDDDAEEAKGVIEKVIKEEEDDETTLSVADSKAITSTLFTSFHASKEGPVKLKEQFGIQDEVSQKMLENLVSGNGLDSRMHSSISDIGTEHDAASTERISATDPR